MELHVLGVSFRTAPAAVREALSFDREQARGFLQAVGNGHPDREFAVLSTCNRTEFYIAAPRQANAVRDCLARLRTARPDAPILRSECLRYQYAGRAAAGHLIRVACGLDSAVLGDVQILGQVKQAMNLAAEAGSLGRYLQKLFTLAVNAGKRARRDTDISAGTASIGAAVAGMLMSRCTSASTRLLMIGTGEAAHSIARNIAKRCLGQLRYTSRTPARADAMAARYGGEAIAWTHLSDAVAQADIVVAATSVFQPLLSRRVLEEIMQQRPGRPLLIIDAGLPRNVEPGSSAELIDIDSIREHQEDSLAKRRVAVPEVERIVQTEVDAWQKWLDSRFVEEAIKELFQEADAFCSAATARLTATGLLTTDEAHEVIERPLRRFMHFHSQRLRGLRVDSPDSPPRGFALWQ